MQELFIYKRNKSSMIEVPYFFSWVVFRLGWQCRDFYPLAPLLSSYQLKDIHRVKASFPGGSMGKGSVCNAADARQVGSIPGLGRSLREGNGNPLQYSCLWNPMDFWSSLVAQTAKNLPAMRETWVLSLCWEDPLEEGMATHSSIPVQRTCVDRKTWWASPWGCKESDTTEVTEHIHGFPEKPGGPQSTEPRRVGHDQATKQQQSERHIDRGWDTDIGNRQERKMHYSVMR